VPVGVETGQVVDGTVEEKQIEVAMQLAFDAME